MDKDYENRIIQEQYLSKIGEIIARKDECVNNINLFQNEVDNFAYVDNNICNLLEDIRIVNKDDMAFIRQLEAISNDLDDARQTVNNNFHTKYEEFMMHHKELEEEEENVVSEYKSWMKSLEFEDEKEEFLAEG
ncbi:MAG: hypothetical protein E7262_08425 [Lachnospiraceae bacterium]|nr:hypothetical protein [Lachnospiraceae bacterium]